MHGFSSVARFGLTWLDGFVLQIPADGNIGKTGSPFGARLLRLENSHFEKEQQDIYFNAVCIPQ